MSYNTTIIEKIFRGHTMAVFANPPLPPLNGPLCGVKQQAQLEGWGLDGFTHTLQLLLAQPPNTSTGLHPIKAVSVQTV